MATTSPWVNSATDCTQFMKQAPNWSGSSRPNTRPKVSWDGMPWGSRKNRLNHSRRALPNSSISTQLSAPQITPQMVMTMLSSNSWRLARSARGSTSPAKCSTTRPLSRPPAICHPPHPNGLHFSLLLIFSPICDCPAAYLPSSTPSSRRVGEWPGAGSGDPRPGLPVQLFDGGAICAPTAPVSAAGGDDAV